METEAGVLQSQTMPVVSDLYREYENHSIAMFRVPRFYQYVFTPFALPLLFTPCVHTCVAIIEGASTHTVRVQEVNNESTLT